MVRRLAIDRLQVLSIVKPPTVEAVVGLSYRRFGFLSKVNTKCHPWKETIQIQPFEDLATISKPRTHLKVT